ncbi:MAG: hypothetical protein ABSH41_04795 [Syntrophobacteraceae bacterium]
MERKVKMLLPALKVSAPTETFTKWVLVMFTVFGDESYDEKKEHVFVVAGIIGTEMHWSVLREPWVKILDGEIFHAADWESEFGPFQHIPMKIRAEKYKQLTTILANSGMQGYAVAMDLSAWRYYFPGTPPNTPYYHCFSRCLQEFTASVNASNSPDIVNFTFDTSVDTDCSAGILYHAYRSQPLSEYPLVKHMADEITFANRKKVGIQAADLWAREVMKFCYSRVLRKDQREARKSIRALNDSGRFTFDFHSREYFEDFRNNFERLQDKTGIKLEDYELWLSKKNLCDSEPNRMRYLADFENISRQIKQSEKEN